MQKESLIRTLVPILYGLLVRLGVVNWLGVDDSVLIGFITLVVTGAIYVAIRFAEAHKTAFGWLLGYPSPPSYEPRVKGNTRGSSDGGYATANYAVLIMTALVTFVLSIIIWNLLT
jgi:hypothetical protein